MCCVKKLISLLLLICLSLPIVPTSAQDSQCDLASFFASLSELKSTGDQEKDITLVSDLEASLRALRAACAPYHLDGKGRVLTEVIELPAGIYRAEFKSTDSIIGSLEVISGECEMDHFGATDGLTEASQIIRSEGCQAAFQFSIAWAAWTITIVPLD